MKIYLFPDLLDYNFNFDCFELTDQQHIADIVLVSDREMECLPSITPNQTVIIWVYENSPGRFIIRDNTRIVEYKTSSDLYSALLCEIMIKLRTEASLKDNIRPYAQEIINLEPPTNTSDKLFEVLARYQYDGKAIVGAEHLLSFLDKKSAFIIFEALVSKMDLGSREHTYSFNLPVSILNDEDCLGQVLALLTTNEDHFKKKMIVEITEEFNETELDSENIIKLSKLVKYVFIDDFGSGRANLDLVNHLKESNVGIKIDRGYFSEITSAGEEYFINMGNSLLTLLNGCPFFVFEGVETDAQLGFLRKLKVINPNQNIWYQGFISSRPAPVSHYDK